MARTRTITVTECKCVKCGYEWFPKVGQGEPKHCAKCRNPKWKEPYIRNTRGARQRKLQEASA